MNSAVPQRSSDPSGALARSLFGFALIAWIPLCLTFVLLALARSSPQSTYAQLQRSIVIASGFATAIGLLGTILSYRLDQESSYRIASSLFSAFGRRWLALGLLVLFIEANILAQVLLRDIAPSVTSPFRLLLFCWTLTLAGLLATIHWPDLRRAYIPHRDIAAFLGSAIVALLLLLVVALATNRIVSVTGLQDRLRGALDYRPLRFSDDGDTPTAQEFWLMQGQTKVRWLPYSYWVVAPFQSSYINVSETGLRKTITFDDDSDSPSLHFYGGSTAWGEGARDEFTIPSQVARLLNDRNVPTSVSNYAQTGYVSTQDLILFQRQLALGNAPDLAVFYQGFNDIYSAYTQGQAGLPLGESHRVDDVEAGRLLRQGQPVLRALNFSLSEVEWGLVTPTGASAREIADNWLANRRLILAAANAYDVNVLFVWQPAFFAKTSHSDFEAQMAAKIAHDLPGFNLLYQDVDNLIREIAKAEYWNDVIILSDLFAATAGEIFFDEVHINEIGNSVVADALVESIAARLSDQ